MRSCRGEARRIRIPATRDGIIVMLRHAERIEGEESRGGAIHAPRLPPMTTPGTLFLYLPVSDAFLPVSVSV